MPAHHASKPPPAPPTPPSEMTTDMLMFERRSKDPARANAARIELERRESARHESMCTLVDRMVTRLGTPPAGLVDRLS